MSFRTSVFVLVWIAIIVTGISLGRWQLARLGWKTTWINTIETAYKNPTLTFPPEGPIPETFFKRGIVDLVYAPTPPLFLKPYTHEGQMGAHLWMKATLPKFGRTLWVNRGFIPDGVQSPNLPRQERGMIQLRPPTFPVARLQAQNPKSPLTDSEFRLIGVLEPHLGKIETTPPFRVGTHPQLRNEHASYALFWFGMSGVASLFLIGGVIARHRPHPHSECRLRDHEIHAEHDRPLP